MTMTGAMSAQARSAKAHAATIDTAAAAKTFERRIVNTPTDIGMHFRRMLRSAGERETGFAR
jgi:hypothetical protein